MSIIYLLLFIDGFALIFHMILATIFIPRGSCSPRFTMRGMGLRGVKWLPKVTQLGEGQGQHWVPCPGCWAAASWSRAGGGFPGPHQVSPASEERWPLCS